MGGSYSCTFAGCGKLFSRAYELKKHKATHEDPDSVYYCPQCNFITLQKKNLKIHFAIHTGEKVYQCPDAITFVDFSGSPAYEERCEYKTHDPAALTKHRKKVHGYIPSATRSGCPKAALTKPTLAFSPYQYPRPCQRPVSVPCRNLSTLANNNLTSNAGYTSTCTDPPNGNTFSPFLWQGNMDAHGQSMNAISFDSLGYNSTVPSSVICVAPNWQGTGSGTLYDPSKHSEWMMGHSTSDVSGLTYLPEPLHVDASSVLPDSYTQTGREGCLCPEWMVEAGIEGWDQSVLEAHKEFYTFDA